MCRNFTYKDLRGEKDLDGNPLKVTFQATSDNLAAIANHEMGEEEIPHNNCSRFRCELTDRRIKQEEMVIPMNNVYIRSFST